ncbi:MAG TPA: tyrosine-type recombinase/integrase [Candidatus Dormibacteraeota bacterium]|nr:tyrosine-type recombinase/integrase [Candidatus Dormibacteraeota bacterium]
MSGLPQAAEEYLAIRRRLGYKLKGADRLLSDFVAHLERNGSSIITTELALAWARQPAGAAPSRWAQRLTVVRGLAGHLHAIDSCHEVPPADLLPRRPKRATPYLYGEGDVLRLMAATRKLSPPLRAATYEAFVGLLATTGMRVGEVIHLDRADLNWSENLLVVRSSKFGKSREVVLHPSAVAALRTYDGRRRRFCPRPRTPAFFVSTSGTRLFYQDFHRVFTRLLRDAEIEWLPTRSHPRPHGLRHTFAVNTLLDWYRAGLDASSRMHLLSTYLGHTNPADTYWYLSAVPELMALAGKRLENDMGELP